jgi:hypothetical protein
VVMVELVVVLVVVVVAGRIRGGSGWLHSSPSRCGPTAPTATTA